MSPPEIAFMQAYAGQKMAAYGYQLENVQFSLGERAHMYLVDWQTWPGWWPRARWRR
jgi:hypothetical protein